MYKHYLFDWGNTLMIDYPDEIGPMYKWEKVAAIDGAAETLTTLSQYAKCYVATNAEDSAEREIIESLKRVGLDQYLSGIFCSRSLGAEKPDRHFFSGIVNQLSVKPSEIVMIGDSLEKDVLGAQRCGISAIWYNPRNKPVPEGIITITRLTQLLKMDIPYESQ